VDHMDVGRGKIMVGVFQDHGGAFLPIATAGSLLFCGAIEPPAACIR